MFVFQGAKLYKESVASCSAIFSTISMLCPSIKKRRFQAEFDFNLKIMEAEPLYSFSLFLTKYFQPACVCFSASCSFKYLVINTGVVKGSFFLTRLTSFLKERNFQNLRRVNITRPNFIPKMSQSVIIFARRLVSDTIDTTAGI